MLGAIEHSKYRAGVGKLQFMINEVPEIALRCEELVATIGETIRVRHARAEAVCEVHSGTQRRVAAFDGAGQISQAR